MLDGHTKLLSGPKHRVGICLVLVTIVPQPGQ
jgi:hypothetical protein